MPTVKRFEDLRIWQSARELVKVVYTYSNRGGFQRDFGLRDQIRRAVISIMSNIAEGFSAGSDAEFARFLGYSRRSLSEVLSQLYVALDLGYISQTEFDSVYQKGVETEKQINAFIAYLARSKSNKAVREDLNKYTLNSSLEQDDSTDLSDL